MIKTILLATWEALLFVVLLLIFWWQYEDMSAIYKHYFEGKMVIGDKVETTQKHKRSFMEESYFNGTVIGVKIKRDETLCLVDRGRADKKTWIHKNWLQLDKTSEILQNCSPKDFDF